MSNGVITTKLFNHYGTVVFTEEDEKYYMCLRDHSCIRKREISQEFYQMAMAEFIFRKDELIVELLGDDDWGELI